MSTEAEIINVEQTTSEELKIETEPRIIYQRRRNGEICKPEDEDLKEDILFPIKCLIAHAENLQGADHEGILKELDRAEALYSSDFGNRMKQERMLEKHVLHSIRVQKIFVYQDFALATIKVKTHNGSILKRSYKLVKCDDGSYLFHRYFSDSFLSPECLKSCHKREKVMLELEG